MFLQPSGYMKFGQTKTGCETPISLLLCLLLLTAALSAAIGCGGLSSAEKSPSPVNQASISIMPGRRDCPLRGILAIHSRS
jgi:hypothetical protein